MNYQEIMQGFDALLSEIDDFFDGVTDESGVPPLTNLNTRLQSLCGGALQLSGDELDSAKQKMIFLLNRLKEASALMDEVVRRENQQSQPIMPQAEPPFETSSGKLKPKPKPKSKSH